MGALGRQSRVEEPLIFVTELVASFEREAGCAPSSTAHCQIGFNPLMYKALESGPKSLFERG